MTSGINTTDKKIQCLDQIRKEQFRKYKHIRFFFSNSLVILSFILLYLQDWQAKFQSAFFFFWEMEKEKGNSGGQM